MTVILLNFIQQNLNKLVFSSISKNEVLLKFGLVYDYCCVDVAINLHKSLLVVEVSSQPQKHHFQSRNKKPKSTSDRWFFLRHQHLRLYSCVFPTIVRRGRTQRPLSCADCCFFYCILVLFNLFILNRLLFQRRQDARADDLYQALSAQFGFLINLII